MLSQKGYISIVIVVFLIMLAIFMFPRKFPKSIGFVPPCMVGEPGTQETVYLPEIANRKGGLGIGGGPNLTGSLKEYVFIRKNVLIKPGKNDIFKEEQHTISYDTNIKPGYKLYYPNRWGEATVNFQFESNKYSTSDDGYDKNQLRFRQEGMVFFVKTDSSSNPQLIDGSYLVDFYQDKEHLNDPDKGYETDRVFECPIGSVSTSSINSLRVTEPAQSISQTKDQLQLQWFLFTANNPGISIDAHCKPAIYLYPKERQLVNVKVNTKGFLTYVDPPYPQDGWSVTAFPDGQIDSSSNFYDYLYYESKVPDQLINKPTKGWVVKYEELESLYKDILPKLGLNEAQTKDFIDYWNKALKNDSPYYFVGIMDQENINSIEPLEITPKPDYINRVRIYFERLDEPKVVEAPVFTLHSSLFTNNSFRVTEWGGMVKNDQSHPLTCSQ